MSRLKIFVCVDALCLSQQFFNHITCADQEGGDKWSGHPPSLKNHKNIRFLCNTGPDPMKNHKATKPAFNVGPLSARQRNTI